MNSKRSAKSGRSKGKPRGKPFQPGVSGNPSGRPVVSPEYRAAMAQLEPMALQVIGDVLSNPKHPHQPKAAEYIINRVRGKPTERREISGPDGEPIGRQFSEIVTAFEKLAGTDE